jgi:hypothetical protein
MGTNAIQTTMTGAGKANFTITNNGTVATPIQHFKGVGITLSGGNLAVVRGLIDGNRVDGGDNIFSAVGISAGSQLGVGQNGTVTATITNNVIRNTDGSGLLVSVTNSGNVGNFSIKNNDIGAPRSGAFGIRVLSGSGAGNTTLCADIANNVSAGTGGLQGIGLRKQGTNPAVNVFGIEGLPAGSTASPLVEAYVDSQNPAGGGTALISAASGFTNCSSAP